MFHFVLLVIGFARLAAASDDGCNEMVCGSVVSKCLLTQSCQCKPVNDCHCCKDCLNCLGELYTECCGCLDMCPKHKDALGSLTPRSEIGDVEGLSELFDTVTAEDVDEWSTIRIPMRAGYKQRLEGGSSHDYTSLPRQRPETVNCTVIYVNACMRSNKCKQQCESMGANSYRWFHDGCCECVGAHCLNYGINESRCSACPEDQDLLTSDTVQADVDQDLENFFGNEDDAPDDIWDYGEDEDMM